MALNCFFTISAADASTPSTCGMVIAAPIRNLPARASFNVDVGADGAAFGFAQAQADIQADNKRQQRIGRDGFLVSFVIASAG
jgi:hypothetical protein